MGAHSHSHVNLICHARVDSRTEKVQNLPDLGGFTMALQCGLHKEMRFLEKGVYYDGYENLFSLCDAPNF